MGTWSNLTPSANLLCVADEMSGGESPNSRMPEWPMRKVRAELTSRSIIQSTNKGLLIAQGHAHIRNNFRGLILSGHRRANVVMVQHNYIPRLGSEWRMELRAERSKKTM